MAPNSKNLAETDRSLPLFYKAPMLLRFEERGDVGLIPGGDFGFARAAVAIPLSNGEFVAAMRHHPIVLAVNEQASRALPDDTVIEWHAKGWLGLVNLRLASLNLQALLDLDAQRAGEQKVLA